jgi:hypothetical protein
MNILTRLQNLERNIYPEPKEAGAPEVCEHPASMFKLRRDYPPKGYSDRRLVTKGHCNACGFDDYLWSFYALTEEQETRRQELGFFERMAYEVELIEVGLIKYALFPPPPEVQIRFTGKVTV